MLTFLKNFWAALRGIKVAFFEEISFQLQSLAAIVVLIFAFFLGVPKVQIIILLFTICLVLTLELVNSIVERILDIIKAEHDPKIKDAKDIMAGAVTISAMIALIVGILIFGPYLFSLLQGSFYYFSFLV